MSRRGRQQPAGRMVQWQLRRLHHLLDQAGGSLAMLAEEPPAELDDYERYQLREASDEVACAVRRLRDLVARAERIEAGL